MNILIISNVYLIIRVGCKHLWGPRGLGDLGRMVIYFRGAGEQAHSFGELGSPAKKQKIINEKPPFV